MSRSNFTFTSESVSEGHPDKVCDRISDAVLDAFIPSRKQSTVYGEHGNLIFLSLILITLFVAFLYKQIISRVRLVTEIN